MVRPWNRSAGPESKYAKGILYTTRGGEPNAIQTLAVAKCWEPILDYIHCYFITHILCDALLRRSFKLILDMKSFLVASIMALVTWALMGSFVLSAIVFLLAGGGTAIVHGYRTLPRDVR